METLLKNIFSMFSKIRLYIGLNMFFAGKWDCWIWSFECFINVILNELRVNV